MSRVASGPTTARPSDGRAATPAVAERVGAVAFDDTAAFEALIVRSMVAPVVGWRFCVPGERLVRDPAPGGTRGWSATI